MMTNQKHKEIEINLRKNLIYKIKFKLQYIRLLQALKFFKWFTPCEEKRCDVAIMVFSLPLQKHTSWIVGGITLPMGIFISYPTLQTNLLMNI